ncbi:MAG: hypothetical protein OXG36_05550, partial [Caldilineaceae bacterium]|nr:hypothetical protein [Caldilineaceae bacterium]
MDKKEYFEYHKAWEECLQVAEGCYYTATCKDPAIGAHVVSEAWLRTLASQGKVYWFSRNKGIPKDVIEGFERGEGIRKLLQRLKKSQPSLVSIGLATRSKFCCKQHDREFNLIDSRENMNLQAPDVHHLNLMFYRALIRQLHVDTAKKALGLRQPDVKAGWSLRPQFDEDSADNLQQPRQVLLQALGAKKGGAWCVRHEVRHIPGRPRVAAACAASWRPGEGVVAMDDLKCTGAWGCTVIPHDGG